MGLGDGVGDREGEGVEETLGVDEAVDVGEGLRLGEALVEAVGLALTPEVGLVVLLLV